MDFPETLACATRRGGIAALSVPHPGAEQVTISSSTFSGLDVVDVCSLGPRLPTPAVCAVGKDRTLVFFRNVLQDRRGVVLKFDRVKGTAYRLICAKGHLLLLTSRSLYIFKGLTRSYLEGQPIERVPTLVREIPMEAVDANLAHDRWLLVVTVAGVQVFDLNMLLGLEPTGQKHEEGQTFSPTNLSPHWATQDAEVAIAAGT